MLWPVCCTRSGPVPYAGTSRIRFYGFAKRVSTERYPDNLKYTVGGFSSSPPQSHTPNLCWNDGMSSSSWATGTKPSKLSSRWLCPTAAWRSHDTGSARTTLRLGGKELKIARQMPSTLADEPRTWKPKTSLMPQRVDALFPVGDLGDQFRHDLGRGVSEIFWRQPAFRQPLGLSAIPPFQRACLEDMGLKRISLRSGVMRGVQQARDAERRVVVSEIAGRGY